MKTIFAVFCLSLFFVQVSAAATLEWDRNAETDMKDYQVWACFTKDCVVIKSASTLQPGTVVQPPVGTVPSYVIDLTGLEGNVAVSARDLSLNESGLSVPAPFDAKAPGVPVAPRFR
jgi:hypothetical protein